MDIVVNCTAVNYRPNRIAAIHRKRITLLIFNNSIEQVYHNLLCLVFLCCFFGSIVIQLTFLSPPSNQWNKIHFDYLPSDYLFFAPLSHTEEYTISGNSLQLKFYVHYVVEIHSSYSYFVCNNKKRRESKLNFGHIQGMFHFIALLFLIWNHSFSVLINLDNSVIFRNITNILFGIYSVICQLFT